MLTQQDQQLIAETVACVEQATAGEISCVLAQEVSHYREIPIAWAALVALILPPIGLALGLRPLALAEMVSGWAAAQNAVADRDILMALSAYAIIQAVLFAAVALVVSMPTVRRALTPGFLKRHRVSQSARHHFAALGARTGTDRPHVLIYASRNDRMVEIIASESIHQAADQAAWRDAATALSQAMGAGRAGEGFVRAIEICGVALARHFPPTGEKRNALPDTLLEI